MKVKEELTAGCPAAWNWPYQPERDSFSEQHLKRKSQTTGGLMLQSIKFPSLAEGRRVGFSRRKQWHREKKSLKACVLWSSGDAVGLKPVGLEPGAFCRWWVQYDSHPALQQWVRKREAAAHVGAKVWVGWWERKEFRKPEKQRRIVRERYFPGPVKKCPSPRGYRNSLFEKSTLLDWFAMAPTSFRTDLPEGLG